MRLELRRQIARAKERAGREHEAASLEGVLPACDLMHLVSGGPHGDVNVLTGIVHGLPGERHPVLPADQSSDASGGRVDCHETARVAIAPYHPLGVGRHELSMMVE